MERKHWRMLWSPRTRGERELLPAWKEVRWNSEQKNIYLAGMPVKSLGNMIHLLIVLMNSFWFHLSWKLHVTALYNTQIERGLPSFFSYTISNEWNISASPDKLGPFCHLMKSIITLKFSWYWLSILFRSLTHASFKSPFITMKGNWCWKIQLHIQQWKKRMNQQWPGYTEVETRKRLLWTLLMIVSC
jgi:hypothetical protein